MYQAHRYPAFLFLSRQECYYLLPVYQIKNYLVSCGVWFDLLTVKSWEYVVQCIRTEQSALAQRPQQSMDGCWLSEMKIKAETKSMVRLIKSGTLLSRDNLHLFEIILVKSGYSRLQWLKRFRSNWKWQFLFRTISIDS